MLAPAVSEEVAFDFTHSPRFGDPGSTMFHFFPSQGSKVRALSKATFAGQGQAGHGLVLSARKAEVGDSLELPDHFREIATTALCADRCSVLAESLDPRPR